MKRLPRDETMNRRAILDLRNAEVPGLKRKYGAKSLSGFGSIARGGDHEGSDMDIPITFEAVATSDNFFDLKFHLKARFGRPVDLGTSDMFRSRVRHLVEKKFILVP